MRVDLTAGEAPDLIRSENALLASVLARHRPTRIYLVRVDGWFGGKWLAQVRGISTAEVEELASAT